MRHQLSADSQGDGRTAPDPYSYTRPLRAGVIAILAIFGGFGSWAALAPLDSAVIANGIVKFENNRKLVQHREGGIVQEILVNEGELVQQGSLLIRLDDTQARARAAIKRRQLESALILEARLVSELKNLPEIELSEEVAALVRSKSARDLLDTQRLVFAERRQAFRGRVQILEQKIDQYRREIGGLEQQKRSWQKQQGSIRKELAELKGLEKKGFFPKSEVLAKEREIARLEGEIGGSIASIARTDKEIGTTRLEIAQLRRDAREAVVAELNRVRDAIGQYRQEQSIAEDVLERVEIRSPLTGIVQGLKVYTIGGVINPAETLMEIVPVDDRLIVEAQVAPLDIDDIKGGETAEVRFAAFKQRRLPVILGKVIYISADSFSDPQTNAAHYIARVSVSEDQLKLLGSGHELQAGMPAEVFIQTGSRTLFEYLWQPFEDAISRGFKEG